MHECPEIVSQPQPGGRIKAAPLHAGMPPGSGYYYTGYQNEQEAPRFTRCSRVPDIVLKP